VASYIARRLLLMAPVLLILSIIVFVMLRVLPGDPLVAFAGSDAGRLAPEQRAALKESLGLNDPLPVQYLNWLGDTVRGEWGRTLVGRQPLGDVIKDRLSVTLELGVFAWLLAMTVGIPTGILSALKRNSWLDVGITAAALAGIAVPNFVLGLLLIIFFGVYLDLLPTTGWVPLTEDPVGALQHLILPAVALGAAQMASIVRQTRSAMLEVLREDFIRTAVAKGLRRRGVIWRHAVRNAMLPLVTLAGIQVGHLASGAIVTETLFGLPGIGRLAADAVIRHDNRTVQLVVMLLATFVLLANLAADVLYRVVDPRIRMT
jgi:peptide/nickel transport system permease protein